MSCDILVYRGMLLYAVYISISYLSHKNIIGAIRFSCISIFYVQSNSGLKMRHEPWGVLFYVIFPPRYPPANKKNITKRHRSLIAILVFFLKFRRKFHRKCKISKIIVVNFKFFQVYQPPVRDRNFFTFGLIYYLAKDLGVLSGPGMLDLQKLQSNVRTYCKEVCRYFYSLFCLKYCLRGILSTVWFLLCDHTERDSVV